MFNATAFAPIALYLIVGTSQAQLAATNTGIGTTSLEHARQLRDAAMAGSPAFSIVESLTTEVGPRLAGSKSEQRAREWGVTKMKDLGLQNVRIEAFEMPGWERGIEKAEMLSPFPQPLVITALGGSVATPEIGLQGEVVVFENLQALEQAAEGSLRGKIAYVGNAMQSTQTGASYSFYIRARRQGAIVAAGKGAIALLIRSIGTDSHRFPHTGMMNYSDEVKKIPAAALSNPDADQLERTANYGRPVEIKLTLTPRPTGTVSSGNVIGEIIGTERPEEIIIIGGHLDSWDLGTGAIDDGAGVAIAAAAAKLIIDSGKKPRRTIRLIFWGAEEVGLLGGLAYREKYKDQLENHIIGTESDFGAGRAWQLSAQVSDEGQAVIDLIAELVAPIGISPGDMDQPGAGPDLVPLVRSGLPSFRFIQNGMDYFDLHHTPDDTLDKVESAALDQNVAAFAVFAWLAADSVVDFRGPIAMER